VKCKSCGTDGVGLTITGDPKNREPEFVRIEFPGGQVEVVRARDGADADYWVHLKVYRADSPDRWPGDGLQPASVTDGRMDIYGKHAAESIVGDLNHPKLYHLAVRVTRDELKKGES